VKLYQDKKYCRFGFGYRLFYFDLGGQKSEIENNFRMLIAINTPQKTGRNLQRAARIDV